MKIAYWIVAGLLALFYLYSGSTKLAPALSLVAALGLLVLQVLATVFHLSRHETKDLWLNLLLVVLAGVAAWLSRTF